MELKVMCQLEIDRERRLLCLPKMSIQSCHSLFHLVIPANFRNRVAFWSIAVIETRYSQHQSAPVKYFWRSWRRLWVSPVFIFSKYIGFSAYVTQPGRLLDLIGIWPYTNQRWITKSKMLHSKQPYWITGENMQKLFSPRFEPKILQISEQFSWAEYRYADSQPSLLDDLEKTHPQHTHSK